MEGGWVEGQMETIYRDDLYQIENYALARVVRKVKFEIAGVKT